MKQIGKQLKGKNAGEIVQDLFGEGEDGSPSKAQKLLDRPFRKRLARTARSRDCRRACAERAEASRAARRSKRWVNPAERARKFFCPEGKIFLA